MGGSKHAYGGVHLGSPIQIDPFKLKDHESTTLPARSGTIWFEQEAYLAVDSLPHTRRHPGRSASRRHYCYLRIPANHMSSRKTTSVVMYKHHRSVS